MCGLGIEIKIAIGVITFGILIALLIPASNTAIYETSGLKNAISSPTSNTAKYLTVDQQYPDNQAAPGFTVDRWGNYLVNVSLWYDIPDVCCKQVSILVLGAGLKRLLTKFCRINNCDNIPNTCVYTQSPTQWASLNTYAYNLSLSEPIQTCSGAISVIKDDTVLAGTVVDTLAQFFPSDVSNRNKYPGIVCCNQIYPINIEMLLVFGLQSFCFIGGDCNNIPSTNSCTLTGMQQITQTYIYGDLPSLVVADALILTPPITACNNTIISNVTVNIEATYAKLVPIAIAYESSFLGYYGTTPISAYVNNCSSSDPLTTYSTENIWPNPSVYTPYKVERYFTFTYFQNNYFSIGNNPPSTAAFEYYYLNGGYAGNMQEYDYAQYQYYYDNERKQAVSLIQPSCAAQCCQDEYCRFYTFTNYFYASGTDLGLDPKAAFYCLMYSDYIFDVVPVPPQPNSTNGQPFDLRNAVGAERTISAPMIKY